jgi:hypothetical protein
VAGLGQAFAPTNAVLARLWLGGARRETASLKFLAVFGSGQDANGALTIMPRRFAKTFNHLYRDSHQSA